ncbi:4'-phosphopantetheinyl transferase [Marinobacter nanhaiticus D15-8W]|uniref:Enterobactin synthase component D n=1 Tax=Marinobacter nanhaiticus D15-8W TaxID=626887 RepID=N6X6N0_9GAMM|nr:4'-phosphopantetheinyl transferase superfamily protein [Marinobacter nanhaiticus]ENO16753.1 4'-phosphopantetheinyl transferase [Marinobacter nanhaiticus D15-8W]BES72561.1 4'-phosphopantetheinyl transferase [Marinobacter nanhaiticus D15-8W]
MTSLPLCCSALDDSWPWRQPLPDLQLIALNFDTTALQDGDFLRCGIDAPPSVQRAVAKRKTEYLAGRLCAREALFRSLGITACPGTGEDRAPLWPRDCVGSITHSHGWAAAVVGRRTHYAGLGLDVEQIMPDARALKLAHQILTANEQDRFAGQMANTPGEFLTLAFSLKESLFKALYPLTRQRFYFEHAELVDTNPDGSSRLRLLTDLSTDWCSDRELDAHFTNRNGRVLSLVAVEA